MLLGDDLLAISNLLGEGREGDDSSDAQTAAAAAFFAGEAAPGGAAVPPVAKHQKQKADPKAIWDDKEVPTEYAIEDETDDPRPQPEYDILYKQDVMSEDIFLGMGDKTPGSQDCTHMVVKVVFPGATMADLDLDVTKERLRAASSKLKLNLYLPLPVDDSKG
eukprot:TRINITY_DN2892_c0_g1_i1.p1 TRINITY_DN2892_c0_g1~~TRINITY_DN2892_c0_g1_i1.p1  ORF type:complete len:172 (-),score=40.05 TRINITY_DN2892_c0_g1_i1:1094-1582(-)